MNDGEQRSAAVTESLVDLVIAARAGDRRATATLMALHLPLLYRLVGRALDDRADVDDVVQETVIRAYRELPALRAPASFRSWLIAIAGHQVSGRLKARRHEGDRTAPLADAAPLAGPEFADLALLRLELSAQRRQAAEAARWLDPEHARLVPLWWREQLGEITRAELVRELGVTAAHARVRVQRMRRQLESSRHLVAALDAGPGCPGLAAAAADWDGTPSPRWRKRLVRHLRDCPVCGAVGADFVPLERLVVAAGAVPLPVGAGMAGAAAAGSAGAAGAATAGLGWLGPLTGAKVAAAVLITAAVGAGAYAIRPQETAPTPPAAAGTAPRPAASPAGTAPGAGPAPSIPAGAVVLRPAGAPARVLTRDGDRLIAAADATAVVLTVTPGLADRACLSLRAADGRYVRHSAFQLVFHPERADDVLFRQDATFCPGTGPAAGTVRLTSLNYPDRMIRVRAGGVDLDEHTDDPAFVADSTFVFAKP